MTGVTLTFLWVLFAPGHQGFERCEDCHVPEGWHTLKAGGGAGFNHDGTGFPLRGAHAQAGCERCHKGETLTDARCVTCHRDAHQGTLGDACDRCHSTRSWDIPQAVNDHRKTRFSLEGRHATAACRDCHPRAGDDQFSGAPIDCVACHAADAAAPSVHPNHQQAGFSTRCEECHSPYGFKPANVRHDRYWPLRGAHATADCFQCHTGGRYAGTSRVCLDCHRDDFASAHQPSESTDCETCHRTTAWLPATMPDHSRFFPLPHEGVSDCQSCHPNGTDSFTCTDCHAHGKSRMDDKHDDVGGYLYQSQSCYRCHPRGDD